MSRRHLRTIRLAARLNRISKAISATLCGGAASRYQCESLERRCLLSVSLSMSGGQTIGNFGTVNASNDNSFGQSEMVMDINPTNPLNIAGFVHHIGGFNEIDIYHSEDGGVTWTKRAIDNGVVGDNDGLGAGFRFDPTITFDANGFLYVAYGIDTGPSTSVVVARSSNGGASFTQFRTIATNADINNGTASELKGNDKWQLASGPDGLGGQAVYIAYTSNRATQQEIVVDSSNNGGANWLGQLQINDTASNGNLFAMPAIGPTGAVVVVWHNLNTGQIKVDRDLDGCFNGALGFGADVVARSQGAGSLFDSLVPAQPERGIATGPIITVDRSGGPFNGRFYIAYCERFSGNDTDIHVMRSDTAGASWTDSTAESSTGTDFLPFVSVDQHSGAVGVLYYSSKDDHTTGDDDVKPFVALSIDGGIGWTRTAISSQTSNETGGYGGDYLEYIGFAMRDGTAHAFWASRHGVGTDLDAFTTTVDFISSTASNILTINGDVGNDSIQLRTSPVNANYMEVFVNGVRQYAGVYLTLDGIVINAGAGSDNISIDNSIGFAPITINGGDGNDHLDVTFPSGNLANAGGAITFNGQNGTDDAVLWDDLQGASNTYTVTSSSLSRAGFGGFIYGTLESLTLQAGSGADTVNINSTSAALVVNALGGNDTINVGNGNLDNLGGGVTANGGTGTDSVNVNDASNGFGDTYTLNTSTVTRPFFAGLTYGTIENLTLNAETGDNIIDVQNFNINVTINAGDGNDLVENPFHDLNTNWGGNLSINGGNGTDVIGLDDSGDSTAAEYTLSATQFGVTAGITTNLFNYATVETFNWLFNTVGTTMQILSTAGGVSYSLDASDGNDTINIGNGNLDNSQGAITLNAGAGTDAVNVNDASAGFSDTYTVTNTTVSRIIFGGLTYSNAESLTLNAEAGSNTINVNTAIANTTINAGDGGDTINLGTGNLDAFGGPVTVNGGNGTDAININDSAASFNDAYTITSTTAARLFFSLTYSTAESLTLNAETGNNAINVNSTAPGTPVFVNANAGTDTINVNETAPTAPVTILPSTGGDAVNVNTDAVGSASALFAATQAIGALTIGAGGSAQVTPGPNKVLTMTSVGITGTGKLDLADNAAIVDYTGGSPIAGIQALLTSGYAGSNWNGSGINSSTAAANPGHHTALGFAEATDLFTTFPATFRGQSVNDNTAVLIAYAYYGDANLDKKVDLTDFTVLAANFNGTGRRWSRGNFNYDAGGAVDLTDFTLLASNFNQMLPAADAAPAQLVNDPLLDDVGLTRS